uniref:AMOP domain-containing protein n=1 Tax=Panagrolaimus superbus TaxID=310955 RepID=A0A914YA30_9BILA
MIDKIAQGIPNSGQHLFKPNLLQRNAMVKDTWKKFHFGFVQVALSGEEDGVLWSSITPFPWYHRPRWEEEYGDSWATDLCVEWFEYDGQRRNFIMDLTAHMPCPCKLTQALLDLGRFMPIMNCDKDGDTSCPYNKGAQHCVQSVEPRSEI